MSTIKRVKLIEKIEFIATVLNLNYEAFEVYITTLNISFNISNKIYPLKKAQIAYLKANNISIKVFSKYDNFANIFSYKLAIKLFELISINNYTIKFVNN